MRTGFESCQQPFGIAAIWIKQQRVEDFPASIVVQLVRQAPVSQFHVAFRCSCHLCLTQQSVRIVQITRRESHAIRADEHATRRRRHVVSVRTRHESTTKNLAVNKHQESMWASGVCLARRNRIILRSLRNDILRGNGQQRCDNQNAAAFVHELARILVVISRR